MSTLKTKLGLLPLNIRQAEALSRIKNGQDYDVIRGWLMDSLVAGSLENNTENDDFRLKWNQGHGQLINNLVGQIDKANDRIKELTMQARGTGSSVDAS